MRLSSSSSEAEPPERVGSPASRRSSVQDRLPRRRMSDSSMPGLVEEGPQVLVAVGAQLGDHLLPPVRDLRADVLEHELLGLSVHDDLAAGRQEREPSFDVALEAAASLPGERAQLRWSKRNSLRW